jgi:hypothetical protein
MCIIAIKESGVEFPSMETMKQCFQSNPDGAGFMFPRAHKVQIEKGFLTWKDFQARYEKILKTYTKKTPFIFHFRIGTHGAKTAGMTHPFPIGEPKPQYTALSLSCDFAFAHNGIFSFLPVNSKFSDTVIYARDILSPLYEKFPDTFIDNGAEKIITATLGWSKLAFMRGNGSIEYFGAWEDERGIHYSNSTYKPYVQTYKEYGRDYWDNLLKFPENSTNGKQEEIGKGKIPDYFTTEEKQYYNSLVFLRAGDLWETNMGYFLNGNDTMDDPFPSVGRIGEAVFQYDDFSDNWQYIGNREKPLELSLDIEGGNDID